MSVKKATHYITEDEGRLLPESKLAGKEPLESLF